MSNQDNYERIERFLNEEMTLEERAEFNALLLESRELRNEVELHRAIKNAVLEEDVIDLEDKISSVFSNQQSEPKTLRLTYRKLIVPLSIAASLLLVFGISILYNPSPNYQKVFNSYYESYPNLLSVRGETTQESNMKKAAELYSNQDFEAAVPVFKEMADLGNEQASFYLALSYFEIHEYEKAQERLKEHLTKYNYLSAQANWYLALSHLKLEQPDPCKVILLELSENGREYSKQAKQLLDELE